ncbi:DUF7619 domain-containing protein [Hymenobacter swuensis]|uniref:IPT/TIG domain-containing protein n=1 Tax=Hymenobacter swuensis DY53 TaxID=1227739 RepID=W8ER27_9BACT|nr:IPT/TIG domain-containing protein [Hymenobacter swuensis]AHJ95594.1 hypothetical protein Hsw_PA0261 [Hymenobacter swuensis DY53]
MKQLLRLLLLLLGLHARSLQAQLPVQPAAFSSAGYDNIVSATHDAQGRLYVLGFHSFNQNTTSSTPPAIRTTAGTTLLPGGNSGTHFIATYSPTGQLERLQPYGMGYGGELRSIAVDNAGNIYVTGRETQYTFLLRKLDRNLQTVWSLTEGTSGGAWGNKVLVDAQGAVYVAGTAQTWSMFGLMLRQRGCCPQNDFIIKVNTQGVLQWIRAGLGGPDDRIGESSANSLALDRAGNVVMVGTLSGTGDYGGTTLTGGAGNIIAVNYSPAGIVRWARCYGNPAYPTRGGTSALDVATDEADNLYISGAFYGPQQFGASTLNTTSYYRDALLLKLAATGTPLWAQAGGYTAGTNLSASAYTSVAYRAGKVKVTGYSQSTQGLYESNPVVASYEANGRQAWATNLTPGLIATGNKILLDADQTCHVFGSFKNTFRIGATAFPSYGGQQDAFYVQVLDSARYNASCTIRGTLYQDSNQDCLLSAGEARLGGIIVEALPGPRYGITDSLGQYAIATDTGRYTVQPRLPQRPGQVFTAQCPAGGVSGPLPLPTPGSVVSGVDFGHGVDATAYLVAQVAAGRRRRCAPGTTVVTYANQGVLTSPAAQVLVRLPRYVILRAASQPYTWRADSTLVFAVGPLAPGQSGMITLQDSVACGDPTIRGLTVCTQAWITPGVVLTRPAGWNQANLQARGAAQAGNQVRFVLRNIGVGATTDSLAMRLYQGNRLALQQRFLLAAGDSLVLRVPAREAVVRLEADQPAAHPLGGQASANVELSALRPPGGAPSPAMAAFPPAHPGPSAAEECLPIVDSYDPNDKQVVPAGRTAQRYTPTNVPLQYMVRFQNTGTDAAYRVVVVDTLAAQLDVRTLRLGAASHRYRLRVTGTMRPVLTFTFDPIFLPDSASNEPASQGFVQFTVQPKAGLPDLTEVRNHADIYFDYNLPVRTNSTLNRLHDLPAVIDTAVALSYPAVLATPAVLTLSPAQGRAGTLVMIAGRRLALLPTAPNVYFNGVLAPLVSATATGLVVRVPGGATTGPVKVVTADGAGRSAANFVVYQPPTLTALTPAEARPGTAVALTGTHFSSVAVLDTVWFNGVAARVLQATTTSLQVEVPVGASTGRVRLSTLGGTVESAQPFRIWYPPLITGFSPAKAAANAVVTVMGSALAEDASRNSVFFGAARATVLQASNGRVQVRVPSTAESGPVRLETPGGAASAAGFTFLPAPVITAYEPTQGSVGTPVTLMGRHFQVDGQPDTIWLAGVPARLVSASPTELRVLVPRGTRTGAWTVAGVGGRSSSTEFELRALPPQTATTVFPNPARGPVTVRWTQAEFTVHSLELLDAVGRRVLQRSASPAEQDELRLELSGVRAGLYMIILHTSQGKVYKRLSVL